MHTHTIIILIVMPLFRAMQCWDFILLARKSTYYCFVYADRKHETPGSEINDFITHSKNSQRFIFMPVPPCPRDPMDTCMCSECFRAEWHSTVGFTDFIARKSCHQSRKRCYPVSQCCSLKSHLKELLGERAVRVPNS